jgi:hypothetical protein
MTHDYSCSPRPGGCACVETNITGHVTDGLTIADNNSHGKEEPAMHQGPDPVPTPDPTPDPVPTE